MPQTPRTSRRPATTEPAAEPDDGAGPGEDADEPERGPLRRCAVTRERLPKEAMLRFVVAPDRRLVPDLSARLPGRGIWLSARRNVIETACTKGAFARAARGVVTVPPDLLSGLAVALERRIGDHLGLARRAGQAVSGFAKAREWLDAGRGALVVQASDGSDDERSRFLGRHAGSIAVVAPLSGAALGGIFGHGRAVHVVLAKGRLAESVVNETTRLLGVLDMTDAKGGMAKAGGPNLSGASNNRNQADQ